MSKPIIADNKPIKVELKAGQEYYFCRWGDQKSNLIVTARILELG